MPRLLIIALNEQDAAECGGFAERLGLPFDVFLVSGDTCEDIGAEKVMHAGLTETSPADGFAKALLPLIQPYSHVAAVSSMQSKDLMPRLAGLLGAGIVTDITGIESSTLFKRPVFAGSFIATVRVESLPAFMTFRPSSFSKSAQTKNSSTEKITLEVHSSVVRISETSRGGKRPDLGQANVIVSGGRPLKDLETFEKLIGGLADHLGGAVGATRAAVDSGIAPNELQIGQTGKVVAPDLYIAAGISGATQHVAGMKDSKCIVAINTDANAPIFELADVGLVGDLFEVIPQLMRRL